MLIIMNKLKFLFASLLFVSALAFQSAPAHSLSSITVNSPANGQTFSGNSFAVSGAAEPNATVIILRNGLTLAQTRSDEAGNWSINLSNLPDGENTITARSIKNTGFAYFNSSSDGGVTVSMNQMRLSDNAINPSAPFPIVDTNEHIALVSAPTGDYSYAVAKYGASVPPGRFNATSPADPELVSGAYPANSGANVGTFSADSSKFYSPNMQLQTISVVDVATNAWSKDIDLGAAPVTAWRSPAGLIYVNIEGGRIKVIDPSTDSVTKTIDLDCADNDTAPTTIFSQDAAYAYYFAGCVGTTNKLQKLSLADDQIVGTFNTSFMATNGILNADNSRLYMVSTAAIPNNPDSESLFILDSTTGSVVKTLSMTSGVLGLFYSPDLQHIYAGTPGAIFGDTGLDIVDMFTDTVQHISTASTVLAVSADSTAATLSNVNVSVVLGVKTATSGGSLANTGAVAVSATILAGIILGSSAFIYYDYRRHKKPLVAEDSHVRYTLLHHVKVVTIPLLKYRLSFQFESRESSDNLHKF